MSEELNSRDAADAWLKEVFPEASAWELMRLRLAFLQGWREATVEAYRRIDEMLRPTVEVPR